MGQIVYSAPSIASSVGVGAGGRTAVAKNASRKRAQDKSERLKAAAEQTSTAVRDAASVLESELAIGLAGVRKIERRLTEERRVDRAEFDNLLERFRTDVHEFIDVGSARIADLQSPEANDLSQRLTADAHELSDTMISMLAVAPQIIDRLLARADSAVPTPATTKGRGKQTAKAAGRGPAGPSK
jgi:hypothetical protein